MKKKMSFVAALLAATVLSGGAYAKTLVYCSEASPANFDPGTTTGGNDFDASSRTIYQPPGRVQARLDRNRAGPCRQLGHFGRRPDLHLPSASRA